MDFVTDAKAMEYLKSFPKKKRLRYYLLMARVDFQDIFPGAGPEAIDFLEKALQLNPKKRLTIEEAINHPLN
jgi:mitogen-activated protein kinase 1/3